MHVHNNNSDNHCCNNINYYYLFKVDDMGSGCVIFRAMCVKNAWQNNL